MDSDKERRISEFLERQEILDCLIRYARGIDRMDRELVLSAYHPDAIDDHIDFVGGPVAFTDWALGLMSQRKRTSHLILNHSCDLQGDTAHCETHIVYIATNQGDQIESLGGRYIDRFEKRIGEWRIAYRVLTMDWVGAPTKPDSGFIGAVVNRHVHVSADRNDISYVRPLMPARTRL